MTLDNAAAGGSSAGSIEDRVETLVSRMTLAEKVSQMVYESPAIERLGVPAYNWWNECLHGVGRAGAATVFPQAIGLAATWNTDLLGRVATATSDEARAKHHEALRLGIRQIYAGLTFWSPNVNIFRDPRWGRGQETYGEDPCLTAALGVAFVRGLQGDDPDYLKLVATPKHLAVHSGPESTRHEFDARPDERDLRETYLPAFEACIRAGRAASVMGAYNRLYGEPCCASPVLLDGIVRQEWGFDGCVMSDCGAIYDVYAHHKVVDGPAEAAALAVRAGCDLECGSVYGALPEAVARGLLAEEDINRSLRRLFAARFRLGMFDPPEQVPYSRTAYSVVNCPQHRDLALQAARESIVLLKNEGRLLPLPRDLRSVAVIGPNADDLPALLGNYHGTPVEPVTAVEGIRRKLGPSARLYYAPGSTWVDGVAALRPIPSDCLRSGDASVQRAGLQAEYYDNPNLAGEPRLSRVDQTVDWNWRGFSPLTGRWGDPFSVRWSGFLVPPVTGSYQLGVNGHNRCRLYLDDELLLEVDAIHHPLADGDSVDLEVGRYYRVQLDYASTGLDPQIQLLWAPPGEDLEAQAVAVASQADVIVAVMGLSPRVEGEEMPVQIAGFAGGDRTQIVLPAPQDRLLRRLHGLGKPVVLVLLNGSAVAVPWAAQEIPAIIEAWYPGESGGEALADVLFGDYNPGGRLPLTFYGSVDDLPPFDDYAMEGRTYRFFRGRPLFPFGHGLSYTTFGMDNLRVDRVQAPAGGEFAVSLDVTNTGDRAGDEVVQLYVRHPDAAVPRPIRELKGFRRIHLRPGERRTVTFRVHTGLLGYHDDNLRHAVHPGPVDLLIGDSSEHLPLQVRVGIVGPRTECDRVFFSEASVT